LFAAAVVCLGQSPAKQRDLSGVPLSARTEPPQSAHVPRGYALVVGIGKYKNLSAEQNLQFPESDAEAMYRVLISQQGGAFPAENVHKLIGSQATLQKLRWQIEEWLPSVAAPEDRVIVYFAGHGFVLGAKGYLAPWDLDPSNPAATAYPMEAIGDVMAGKVRARWKVLLADACHSGKITPESTNEAMDDQLNHLSKGFLTFTATREREKSYEDPYLSTGFGLFTYFLIHGLQGNADKMPCDGVVTADELIDYVRYNVETYTRARGISQTPTERGDFDGDMVLGAGPGCSGGTSPPAMSLGSLAVEATMDHTEVYLDGKFVGTIAPGGPLLLPGLSTGVHAVTGTRKGYEAATQQIMVVPGQERTVILRIQYRQERKRSAVDLLNRGERLLFKQTSSLNPAGIYGAHLGRQTAGDVAQAKTLFEQALRDDPQYSKAAYDLALSCQLLSQYPQMMESFRNAIAGDPSFVEARIEYAGALIESGDPDEAIRQLTDALRLEPGNDLAYSHLSRAFLDKGIWDRAVEAADKSISLHPGAYEAYLWWSDAKRRLAAAESDRSRRISDYHQAIDGYHNYLRVTNIPLRIQEELAYYFVGFGLGRREHADRQTSYAFQRSFAYSGLCECEEKLNNFQRAIDYCKRSLKYDPHEAATYFLLGNTYRDLYNLTSDRSALTAARGNYAKVLAINPGFEFARHARDYLEQIDAVLPHAK